MTGFIHALQGHPSFEGLCLLEMSHLKAPQVDTRLREAGSVGDL